MIAYLTGKVREKTNDYVIIDVGGVGYHVFVSQTSLNQISESDTDTSLHIYTHVREDQLSLFGFTTREEKTIFQRLLNVSGIGPKLALAILSGMQTDSLVQAVIKEDVVSLNAIPGIGRKTAERIVLDLKDKFLKEFAGIGATPTANKPLYNDALSALLNLGYTKQMVDKVFAKIGVGKHTTVQSVVKDALKELKSS